MEVRERGESGGGEGDRGSRVEVRETGELGRHVRDKALGGGEGEREESGGGEGEKGVRWR